MIDPRILTGPCLVIIGCLMLFVAGRLYLVHPLNRVFRLGPFVTERGIKAVLNMRVLFLAFGLFFVTHGASSVTFWLVASRDLHNPYVAALGSLSAGFAIWAAVLAVIAAVRLWRVK